MALELHPLCTLFPRMSGQEFQSLVNDIKENGLREPIIVHEQMILDGGNRYRACIEAGIDPEFMEFGGTNLVSYVLSANLHRRHMTPGQQAAIVASAQDWNKAQTVGNPQLRNVAQLETSADRAAQSGASHRTQQMADKVAKENPELAKQVAQGVISLPKAIKSIDQKIPKLDESEDSDKPEFDESELMAEIAEGCDPEKEYEDLKAENEELKKIIEADDQLKEIKRLTELCRVIEERARGYQSSENAAVRKAKMWKEKFEKLERQVKAAGLVEF